MANFLANVFSSLFGGSDPESQKKRILKGIAKSLAKSKNHFYKASTHEAEPGLAKFFYEIYKNVANAQTVFQETTPNALKNVVLNIALSDKQKEAVEELSEEAINDMAGKMQIKEIAVKINGNIEALNKEFDALKVSRIDALYTKLVCMMNFCKYDYYFILKKFAPGLREKNFQTAVRFQAINSIYIAEDLKNFIDVAWPLPFEAEWDDVLKLLKQVKGNDIISPGAWRKVLQKVRPMRDRHIFEMLIQVITENPVYKDTYKNEELHIVDDYIASVKKTAEEALDKIKKRQQAGKIDSLVKQVFGSTEVPKLKNYNEMNSETFERRGIGSFLYANPLAYLKQFLLEYTKKEIREVADILLVRGEWSNQQLSTPVSEAFHQLMEASDRITRLDSLLAEDAQWGLKLKTHLPRSERDRDARGIIQTTLKDANNEAAKCIISSVQNFMIFDRNLKMLLEDFVKLPRAELLMNWKELDHFAEGRLKEMCVEVYKKIYAFVQLIQTFQIKVEED